MMIKYWRIPSSLHRMGLTLRRVIPLVKGDLRDVVIDISRFSSRLLGLHSLFKQVAYDSGVITREDAGAAAIAQFQAQLRQEITTHDSSKPTIFVSACMSQAEGGGWKFNGGIKEFNCLVKLLRQHGYEAYIVTYDGTYEPWLLDHQPHISLDEFRRVLKAHQNVRCVTSWAEAKPFLQVCDRVYYWNMDLCFSEDEHFPLLASLYRDKIQNTAGISRTIQAWHMAYFNRPCTLLPNLVDDSLWTPDETRRQPDRVGYMDEGPHTDRYLAIIRDIAISQGLELEFMQLKGSEAKILEGMRSCSVFLTLNLGKHELWGEGGPLPPLEAMATGCVPITFDILGPREIIQSGFNGIIVPRYRPDLMAKALIRLYKTMDEIERLRQNALALFNACHTFDARWEAVKAFLELGEPAAMVLEPLSQELTDKTPTALVSS
jgi:hypothetical protein